MKTTVNLYKSEFRPQLRLLRLQFLIITWGLGLLLCLATYFFISNTYSQTSTSLTDLVQKQKRNSMVLKELRYDITNLAVDPTLLENVNQKQKTINFKKQILLEVQGHEKLVSHAFSDLMIDLAANHNNKLWLTRIHIDDSIVKIEGASETPTAIPQWLNSLSNTNFFKGQEFSETRLYRGQDNTLNFVLSADVSTDSKELTSNE